MKTIHPQLGGFEGETKLASQNVQTPRACGRNTGMALHAGTHTYMPWICAFRPATPKVAMVAILARIKRGHLLS
jgi:hypothetical protein